MKIVKWNIIMLPLKHLDQPFLEGSSVLCVDTRASILVRDVECGIVILSVITVTRKHGA
mgnify:CR=1 FL=1